MITKLAILLVIEPELAVIEVEPRLTAVARPVLLMVATAVLLECQVAEEESGWVEPSV